MSNLIATTRPQELSPIPKFAVFSTETTAAGQSYAHANIYDGYLNYHGLATLSTSFVSYGTDAINPGATISSGTSNLGSAVCTNGWTGNVYLSGAAKLAGNTFVPTGTRRTPYEGTHIDFEGVRGSVFTGCVGTVIYLWTRGGHCDLEVLSLTNAVNDGLIATPFTDSSWRGVTCYNRRIKTLSLLEPRNNAGSYRYHMWTNNAEDITGRYIGQLRNFMKTAYDGVSGANYTYVDFTWNTGISTDVESFANVKVIHGDNGVVGLSRFTPSNGNYYATLDTSTGVTTDLITLSGTTSYGGSTAYSQRWNTNWDNSVMACYSHYYYYGAGIMCFFINTRDPSKVTSYKVAQTSTGYSVIPDGKSSFYIANSQNTNNSSGLPLLVLPKDLESYNNSNTTGTVPTYTTYVDVAYTSTHYPPVVLLDNWGD